MGGEEGGGLLTEVEKRAPRVISRLPFKLSRMGVRMNSSSTRTNTGQNCCWDRRTDQQRQGVVVTERGAEGKISWSAPLATNLQLLNQRSSERRSNQRQHKNRESLRSKPVSLLPLAHLCAVLTCVAISLRNALRSPSLIPPPTSPHTRPLTPPPAASAAADGERLSGLSLSADASNWASSLSCWSRLTLSPRSRPTTSAESVSSIKN